MSAKLPARGVAALVAVALILSVSTRLQAQPSASPGEQETEIQRLESMIRQLDEQVQELRQNQTDTASEAREQEKLLLEIREDMDQDSNADWFDADHWTRRFHVGGYGEIHANFTEDGGADQMDIHRLVLYAGYDFADWIKFHSELELEHAWSSSSSGGYMLLEQAYFDFLMSPRINARVGRILTPMGIINQKHEPTRFNGVERPSFAKYIIPTTWSSDGAGIFGNLAPWLQYQLYVVGGLDGSGFSGSGIRGGRIKERPSLHEPAVTGRLDFYPFLARPMPHRQQLRVGVSGYFGGLDNGNKGSNPDIDGHIGIISADFEYSVGRFDFRGVGAYETIDGAREIGNNTAEGIFGFYLEGAYHFLPDAWKTGKLADADAVAFIRYDLFDTQHNMPSGVGRDPTLDRSEWTFGVSFYPVDNIVLKADYQLQQDAAGSDLDHKINFGIGWEF